MLRVWREVPVQLSLCVLSRLCWHAIQQQLAGSTWLAKTQCV